MTRQLIAETTLAGLRPTGVGGVRVLDSWEQIAGYLNGLPDGGELADLFAEPVAQGGGKIMWFAGEGGDVAAFSALAPERQEALREKLATLLARLEEETTRLETSGNATARLIGETLRRAQQLPGAAEDSLYVIQSAAGDRPVLVNWSTEPEGAPPPVAPLLEFVRKQPEPPPPRVPPSPASTATAAPMPAAVAASVAAAPVTAAPAARAFTLWPLLWLLFLLLLGAIYYLLLVGCAVWPGGGLFNSCPAPAVASAPPPDPLRPDRERTTTLMSELAQLEQRLSQAPRCPEPPRQAQIAPPPQPSPQQQEQQAQQEDFDRRVAETRAREGELTVTLLWDSPSDLDLHVQCPNEKIINFAHRTVCGGQLDVDANANSRSLSPSPVENIYFAAGGWSPGTYTVFVRNHSSRGGGGDTFKVRVKKGDQVTIHQGRVDNHQMTKVTEVQMP
jgi:hypothetical protein